MFRRLVHDSLPPALLVALLSFLTAYPLAMLVYGSLHTTLPGAAGTITSAPPTTRRRRRWRWASWR
jgi:hypothetical protein